MSIDFPPLTLVQGELKKLTQHQVKELAVASGVPAKTLNNIRYGVVQNPGLETVRAFWPLLKTGRWND